MAISSHLLASQWHDIRHMIALSDLNAWIEKGRKLPAPRISLGTHVPFCVSREDFSGDSCLVHACREGFIHTTHANREKSQTAQEFARYLKNYDIVGITNIWLNIAASLWSVKPKHYLNSFLFFI